MSMWCLWNIDSLWQVNLVKSVKWSAFNCPWNWFNSKKVYQLVKDPTTEKQGKSTTIQDKSEKCLTEENEILNRWTEYCSDLYNYETEGDPIVLDLPRIPDEEHHPILWEEVEAEVKALTMGKSAGVDNIPAKLVKQEEKPWLTSWPQSATRFGRQENGRPHELSLLSKPSWSLWRHGRDSADAAGISHRGSWDWILSPAFSKKSGGTLFSAFRSAWCVVPDF